MQVSALRFAAIETVEYNRHAWAWTAAAWRTSVSIIAHA